MGKSSEHTERFSVVVVVIIWLQDASCTDIGNTEEQRISLCWCWLCCHVEGGLCGLCNLRTFWFAKHLLWSSSSCLVAAISPGFDCGTLTDLVGNQCHQPFAVTFSQSRDTVSWSEAAHACAQVCQLVCYNPQFHCQCAITTTATGGWPASFCRTLLCTETPLLCHTIDGTLLHSLGSCILFCHIILLHLLCCSSLCQQTSLTLAGYVMLNIHSYDVCFICNNIFLPFFYA